MPQLQLNNLIIMHLDHSQWFDNVGKFFLLSAISVKIQLSIKNKISLLETWTVEHFNFYEYLAK